MIFEPTGDLSKDYSAFCEIDMLNERDDILDGIYVSEKGTAVRIRNAAYCLNKRDVAPLCLAVPHCSTLSTVELTGCGLTEHSLKLVAQAIYESPSVHTLVADFNPGGLFRDPTVQKKDRNDVTVLLSHFRGAHLKPAETEVKDDPKKKPDPKKAPAAVAVAVPRDEDTRTLSLPTGWHGLLHTGLQVLSLRGNGIGDAQVELLAGLLEANGDLLSLNLWGNEISSAGVQSLAKALRMNRRLTCLDLGHNRVDDVGVAAFMACFLTFDASNEEALRLRQRCGLAGDLPNYPTYNDLAAPFLQPVEEKKDPKKKEPPKKKGTEGPVERLKGEFDKDCVRLDDARVRVPGNTSLWCVSFSQNLLITTQSVACIQSVLSKREAPVEELIHDGVVREPQNYVCGLSLKHLIIEHTKLDKKHQDAVNTIIAKL